MPPPNLSARQIYARHLPDNLLDHSGAKAIYAARRKAAG
jgi:hypothetical protein